MVGTPRLTVPEAMPLRLETEHGWATTAESNSKQAMRPIKIGRAHV